MNTSPRIDSELVLVRLTAANRPRLLAHFLALPEGDRNCRFGAGFSDEAIARYVDGIDLERDCTLALRAADGELVALAQVPLANGKAELGLTVLPHCRRRQLGLLLARTALQEAQRAGAEEFGFEFLAANSGMQRLAERLKMALQRQGAGFVARLPLTTPLAA